jgi:hypothetical protein
MRGPKIERIVNPQHGDDDEGRAMNGSTRNDPNAAFVAVAKIVAKEPPEWMVRDLVRYRRLVGYHRKFTKDDETEDREIIKAAQYLETWLRLDLIVAATLVPDEFAELPIPDCVEAVLNELPELIEYLQSRLLPPREGGPTPDRRLRLCALVCADLWRRQHGEVQPYSPILWEACEAYWRACGHPGNAKGNLKQWEEHLVKVGDLSRQERSSTS